LVGIELDYTKINNKITKNKKIMFRRRKNFTDLFNEFDSMFSQFDSIFGGTSPKTLKEEGTDELGDWSKETYKSEDGSIYITNFVRTSSSGQPRKIGTLEQLKMKLQESIENEDFEEAVKLRDQIKTFESNKEKINKLDLELKEAIKEQNFERAVELRDEIKKLKS
jgi:excinuclease UvrABC helicase subunit UvrB